jgi:hypothetical protein
LHKALLIRNALAHPSRHARKMFLERVVGSLALPPNQMNPAGYLRGQHAVAQTRFEYLLAECGMVVRRLCT